MEPRKELTISTSTGTSRRVTQGMRILCVVSHQLRSDTEVRDVQDGHEDSEPELLCAEQRVGIGSPFPSLDVVRISKNHEHPCGLVCISAMPELFFEGVKHTARPSHPIKRWCLSKVLWWLLVDCQPSPSHHKNWHTDLRTHGKALRTEMKTATLVMIPVAITELC
jgi:hypothetical protein